MKARLLTKQTTIIILTLVSLVVLGIITTIFIQRSVFKISSTFDIAMAEDKGKEERVKKDTPITQEQVDKKFKGWNHKKFKGWNNKAKHHRKPMDPDAIKKKLDDAVKAGTITQEQADEKLKGWNNKAK